MSEAASFERVSERQYLIRGDMDKQSVPALLETARRLLTGESGTVQISLQHVGRSDSAGVALLVALMRESGRNGWTLQFTQLPAQMQTIARVSGVESLLPLAG